MNIQSDSLYWFKAEMPGDESKVGWGPDPEPHIHYQLKCSGCASSDALAGSDLLYFNKFYPKRVCKLDKCGSPGAAHQAELLEDGVYRYDLVISS